MDELKSVLSFVNSLKMTRMTNELAQSSMAAETINSKVAAYKAAKAQLDLLKEETGMSEEDYTKAKQSLVDQYLR